MGIYCDKSILESCKSNIEFLEKFYVVATKNRPKENVVYRPQTQNKAEDVNWAGADLTKVYPEYSEGDYVYFSCLLDGLFERKMLINVRSCSSIPEVWFNSEKKEVTLHPESAGKVSYDFDVTFKKGQNNLTIRIQAEKDAFFARFLPLIPELRMSPDFYVYCSWPYIDIEGFRRQRGVCISKLYKKNELVADINDIDWLYPNLPLQSDEKTFDFSALCKKGCVAYSYTCVCGEINLQHKAPVTVFENGKEVYCAESGAFIRNYTVVTPLLIKARKKGGLWGFKAKTNGVHSLPFVDGADTPDLQWLWIGPFGSEEAGKDETYGPECNLYFDDMYSSFYGPLYWHFYRDNTELRQSLYTNFYGHWFYPLMIGLRGMQKAAAKLGREKEMLSYFSDWMQSFIRRVDYGRYEKNVKGSWAGFMTTVCNLDDLDSIGTVGVNVAEYCVATADPQAKYLLQLLADRLSYCVPRFEDDTFHRKKTMWTDDTYMCLPFLVRLGTMTGDKKYFDDILAQVRGFVKRMWMEDEELFSHIYFVEEKKPNRIPWGRGNGWVMLALSEVLLMMPSDYEGYGEILSIYKKFASGVLRHWDKKTGLWHQVVNNHDSYVEASGSAMYITGLARGIRKGWLDSSLCETVKKAWSSLLEHCIDIEGNLYGVCMGSGCSMDERYYLELKTINNDDHGVGIVLETCVEVMNMLGE